MREEPPLSLSLEQSSTAIISHSNCVTLIDDASDTLRNVLFGVVTKHYESNERRSNWHLAAYILLSKTGGRWRSAISPFEVDLCRGGNAL